MSHMKGSLCIEPPPIFSKLDFVSSFNHAVSGVQTEHCGIINNRIIVNDDL
jgi:hypothetical protein